MKIIKVKSWSEIPSNFTGKVEFESGDIQYTLNGKEHRLDGPAYIGFNGHKAYIINGIFIYSSRNENYEQYFYNSKEYKQAILLENMKRIKGIENDI